MSQLFSGKDISPKASGFYPFDDATDLSSEVGGIAKRLFFMFLFPCRQYFLCGGICEMGIFLGR